MQELFHIGLRLGHVHPPAHYVPGGTALDLRVLEPQQRPGVALRQAVFPQQGPHVLRQTQQAQLVGHCGLGPAQPPGGLLLAEPIAGDQPGDGLRLLPAVQVPALEILHQGQQGGVLLPYLGHQARHLPQSGDPGSPQPPLPGHQLIALPGPADGQGLQNPAGADAGRQLRQALLIEAVAGLLGIGPDAAQGDVLDPGG